VSFLRGQSGVLAGLLLGAVLGGALLMVRFGGLPGWGHWSPGASVVESSDENGMQQGSHGLFAERGNAIVQATRRVAPAVVSINVVQAQQIHDPSMEMWERMGLIPRREYLQHVQSMGSGVIVSKDGLVVTNSHVLESAVQIIVTLSDGSQYQARVDGRVGLDHAQIVAFPFFPFYIPIQSTDDPHRHSGLSVSQHVSIR